MHHINDQATSLSALPHGITPIVRYPLSKGFTLIELLVAVAIIVALLAILMPSMNRAIEMAGRATCMSNERQIMVGGLGFASDHFGKLPKMVSWGWEYELVRATDAEAYLEYVSIIESNTTTSGLSVASGDGHLFYCPNFDFWGAGSSAYDSIWPTYDYGNYDAWVLHPLGYRLYFGSGLQARWRPLVTRNPEMSLSNLGPGGNTATAITCHPMNLYQGNVYPGAHGMEGITSAAIDNSAAWVPADELIYDVPNGTTSALPAIRRPWLGMDPTPHPLSQPVVP